MKRYFLALTCLLLGLIVAYPKYLGDMNGDGKLTLADITKLTNIYIGVETNYDASLTDVNQDNTFDPKDIATLVDMVLGKTPWVEVSEEESDTLYIYYSDDATTYKKPSSWTDVEVTVDGGNVTVTSTNTTEERVTVLQGTCADGSFTYNGSYKTTLVLNGVTLTNTNGAAIAIKCGKRIALELAEGTENTLADGGTNSLKGAFYCKGHLEVSKGGSLTVTGNTKHGITCKEYMLLKKTMGALTIDGANGDGIHVEQYFKMNGGTVSVSGVSSDCIQAELKLDASEDDGKLLINGGTLDLEVTSASSAALKADSTLHITDGDITITTSGNSDKALKSDYHIDIDGGTIGITQTGSYTVETTLDENLNEVYDASYVTALRADSAITITDGTITITNSADGGKGLSSDGNIDIQGGDLTINAYGAGGVLDTSGASSGSTTTSSYKFYISLPATTTSSSQGGFNPGGQSSSSISWGNPSLYKSGGTLIATLSDQVSVGSGTSSASFFYYDFGALTSDTYYITANYTITSQSQGGGGGGNSTTTGTYTSSNLSLNLTGEDVFYAVTATSSGSSRPGQSASYTFSISDVTSTYSGGTIATEEGDTYSSSCLKSDADITLSGGTLTLTHSGEMSKGIKADGKVVLSGSNVTDYATGKYLVAGSDISYCSAVKCGNYEGVSGILKVQATGQASRGIRSDGTISISGGTYDLTLSGDGLTNPNDSSDGIASVGFKSDGNMQLTGGDITINNTAKGGKGIKVGTSEVTGANGASLVIGQSGASNDMLSLDVNTTGEYIGTESSSGGGMGMGPSDGGFIGSTKAIKVMGPITVNSGNIHLSTKSDGAEGLESKNTITFNGGIFEGDTYDDAINAASTITFNDGYVWAHASGNDAIDSNDGTTGIVVNGGVIIGTSTSDPEEAFDCDDADFILNGGVLIGVGGAQGGGGGGGFGGFGGSTSTAGAPTSATQPYAVVSSVSLTSDKYICLKNSSGTVLCSYKMPQTLSSVNILVSHPSLTSGSSATVVYNATSVSGTTSSLWEGSYTTGGTVSGGTSSSISPSTN